MYIEEEEEEGVVVAKRGGIDDITKLSVRWIVFIYSKNSH